MLTTQNSAETPPRAEGEPEGSTGSAGGVPPLSNSGETAGDGAAPEGASRERLGGGPATGARLAMPWWLKFVPFFLSAVFFLSALFTVFSPLPLLLLYFRAGRRWALAAALTNSLIVAFAAGGASLTIYLTFIVALALPLAEFLRKKRSLELSSVLTLGAMALVGLLFVAGYSYTHHLNPVAEIRHQVSALVDYLGQNQGSQGTLVNPADAEEWKQNLLVEFPSALAVFALILVWANLVLLLRVNPAGLRERLGLDPSFLKRWKAPEWLIWPTIVTGFFLLVDAGRVSGVAVNVFKFIMAIYAIQGLSILSFFFDVWGIRGFFRAAGFLLAIFLMMPLLLSLGFFDLWFDFRSKFRQSS